MKLFVFIWVDELVLASSSLEAIEQLKRTFKTKFKMDNQGALEWFLGTKFKIDDQGTLEWFLGIQKNEHSEKTTLDQETYVESVPEKLGMQESNSSKTPAENNLKLVKATEVEPLVQETLYRSLVGSPLFCIAKQSRPDIMSLVGAPLFCIAKQSRPDIMWIVS